MGWEPLKNFMRPWMDPLPEIQNNHLVHSWGEGLGCFCEHCLRYNPLNWEDSFRLMTDTVQSKWRHNFDFATKKSINQPLIWHFWWRVPHRVPSIPKTFSYSERRRRRRTTKEKQIRINWRRWGNEKAIEVEGYNSLEECNVASNHFIGGD